MWRQVHDVTVSRPSGGTAAAAGGRRRHSPVAVPLRILNRKMRDAVAVVSESVRSNDSTPRVAGRVVLVHRPTGRLLLQLHGWPHEPHWATPGGGVEDSETPRDAARRELTEETGRRDEPGAELFIWEHDYVFAAAPVLQRETYFLVETDDDTVPVQVPDTMDGIVRRAWVTLEDIGALAEPVWPLDLVARVTDLVPHLRRQPISGSQVETWESRVREVWASADDRPEAEVLQSVEELAGELLSSDPKALFERASAHDYAGREAEAEHLYRQALDAGLSGARRAEAVIQLASTLRLLGRPAEAVTLLDHERTTAAADDLDGARTAFLALALIDAGQGRRALAEALNALADHLPRYQRAVRHYADDLRSLEE
ncbi:tetratricopeptide repeat protein [Pseudokineococcus sp. 5B2Z-1]|uniref:tetratricopeptide repeat protein n=1 Tax=Pseudokineococcus sp. 5B2Z-1 TaxID=3132744 RepID=UPI0030B58F59